jgi:hypothetical protein
MAKRLAIPSKSLQLQIVGPRDFFKAPRVQRLSLATNVPPTTIDEIGASAHVGTTKDVPDVTLQFQAFDVSHRIFAALTGYDPAAYPASGVDISLLGQLDAMIAVKDDLLTDYSRYIHAKRMQISTFTYTYNVTGESTEEYTAVGSERRWLMYDVQVDKFVAGTTSFTLTKAPIQLKNGRWALSVILDGAYLDEVSTAPATGQYRIVGTTLTTFDTRLSQILIVYHAVTASPTWADVADSLSTVAIRGKDVQMRIAANNIPRVQSVTLNGNLQVAAVKEMANRAIVGYQRQIPTVEGNITVLDTDTDLVSLLTNGVIGSGIEWMPGEGCTTSGVNLEIRLYDPCDVTNNPPTTLKTVYLPSISIVGETETSNVNNNAQLVFNFRSNDAHCYIFSGLKTWT